MGDKKVPSERKDGGVSGIPSQKTPRDANDGAVQDTTKRAVCVALRHDGKSIRLQGSSPTEFISAVQDSTLSWINFSVEDFEKESIQIATLLGFSASLAPTLLKGYYASFEDRETEVGIMLPALRIKGLDLTSDPLLILVRKNLIVTIHKVGVIRLIHFSRYADNFIRKLPQSASLQDKLTMMLIRIIDENNSYNFEDLREIEEQADSMSELLLDPKSPRLEIGRKIYEMKHTLITYLNTLWRTLDVLHSLRYGDAELISDNPKMLARIGLLVEDVNRQIALSEHMSEVLASGLEVLQSIYNNQLQVLNNRMALTMTWLTILGTAVLVPNTLATIFGSMIGLDHDTLMWYIIVLVLSTANATYLAYWWVKRWVQLPTSPS